MAKKLLIIILATFASFNIYAQANIEISQEKVVENGQKYYLHTVSQGQTLYSICKAYSTTEKDVLNCNPELQSGTLSIGQIIKIPIINELSKDGKSIVYTVKKGETLYSLLKRFETTEKEFYELNPKLSRSESIRVGDEIYFPLKEKAGSNITNIAKPKEPAEQAASEEPRDDNTYIYHIVQQGETLFKISRQYDVTLAEIYALNTNITNGQLSIGETIRIRKKQNTDNESEASQAETNAVDNGNISSTCESDKWYTYGKTFTIAMLLPLETEANIRDLISQENHNITQRLRAVTERAVDFYSGALVALESFKNEDIKIKVKVFDIGKDNAVLTSLVSENKFNDIDMIIGPANKSQVDYLNSTNLGIPMLLPFVSDEGILKSNQNNIMLNPSKQDIRNAVAKYASQVENSNVLIIRGTTDESKMHASKYAEAMQNAKVTATTLDFNGGSIEAIGSSLKKNANNIIILTFENELGINRVLTQVFKLCKDNNISLIADPKIMNYENIDPNYYAEVKYTYYSNSNINYDNPEVKDFINKYREAFLSEPNTDAYIAADAIKYFIPMLKKAGKGFAPCIDQDYVQNGLGGAKQYCKATNYATNSYSNRKVYIYSIEKDYTFKLVYSEDPKTESAE